MARVSFGPRPLFAVGAGQRITSWSEAAAAASGTASAQALGRPCWAVVHGRANGQAPGDCAGCALLGSEPAPTRADRLSCDVVPLPDPRGGALVSVRGWVNPVGDELAGDLGTLGAVLSTLSPTDAFGSVTRLLEVLRIVAGADDAEMFLVEPVRRDLVMAACLGPDRDVMLERDHFSSGVGYPGVALAQGQPVASRAVAEDRRFLRSGVKRRGLRGFLCVPIPGPDGLMGSVDLAWRAARAPLEPSLALLERVAPFIGTAVSAGLASARDSVRAALTASGVTLEERSLALLRAMAGAARAQSGSLVLEDGLNHSTLQVVSTEPDVPCCNARAGGQRMCPYLAQARTKILTGSRAKWPGMCRKLPEAISSPCCLPLVRDVSLRGTVLLDYGSAPPSPPTRDLVLLLTMAKEGAEHIRDAFDASSGPVVVARPEVEVRCFGSFELRLGGKAVPRNAFSRKKAITLLQLLILKGGAPMDRSALVERLWPDADEESGANRLHGVVHALRTVIEPRGLRGWKYIKNHGDQYWFNVDAPHRIDLYRFRTLVADAQSAERDGRPGDAMTRLEEALELYEGDLFGQDGDSELFVAERVDSRERVLTAYKRLAQMLASHGELDRAVSWLRRGVSLDPLREDIHQQLIEALLRSGRRKEAVEQYWDCAHTIERELGPRPLLPATQRLGRLLDLFETA